MRKSAHRGYRKEFRREVVRLAEPGTKMLAQIARVLANPSRDVTNLAAERE